MSQSLNYQVFFFTSYSKTGIQIHPTCRNPLIIRSSFLLPSVTICFGAVICRNPLIIRSSFLQVMKLNLLLISLGRNPLIIRSSFLQYEGIESWGPGRAGRNPLIIRSSFLLSENKTEFQEVFFEVAIP